MPALAANWEMGISRTPTWEILQPSEMKSAAGATFTPGRGRRRGKVLRPVSFLWG